MSKPVLKRNLIVMGVSGAGKTTVGEELAEAFGARFLEGDSLHPAENVAKMAAGTPLDDDDRKPWLKAISHHLAGQDGEPEGLVATCSSLKRAYRELLTDGVRRRTTFVFLDGSHALLAKRMTERKGHFMPASLLDSQLATLERPAAGEDFIRIDLDADIDGQLRDLVATLAAE